MQVHRLLLASLASMALVATPLVGHASTTDRENAAGPTTGRITFETTTISNDHPAGAVEGTLNLTIGIDGTINGYYRFADNPRLLGVRGGLDGERIYLTIPGSGLDQINGTYVDGAISAYAFDGREIQRFTGIPSEQQRS